MPKKADGTRPHGSRVLTIPTGTGDLYIADNFSVDDPSKKMPSTDELDQPSGAVYVDEFITGSATLQLAADDTPARLKFLEFEEKIAPEDPEPTTFIITKATRTQAKGELQTVQISFDRKYNP